MQKSEVNVLIVEDDNTQREALEAAVKKLGYRPIAVKKPDEAESIARIKPVHGVISDCMLPGKSGVDLVVSLKDNLIEGAPVILISGIYRDKAFQNDAVQKTEAIKFYPKPFEMKELMGELDKHLAAFIEAPKVDLHALLAAPMASQRERRKALDHVEEMYGYDLPFVFCILMESASSGHLNIVDDKTNIYGVTFAKGLLSKVDSESSIITIREILKKHGFITETELNELKNKKSSDLVKNLVNEGLMSPHVQGIVKSEQIVNELNKLVNGDHLNINFVPDRKVKPEDEDVDINAFLPQLHDMIESKIPLDYLKSFYATWGGHPIRLGPTYQEEIQVMNMPLIKKVEGMLELFKKELTLEEVVAQVDFPEENVFKAIHLLAIRRILVFEETKRVKNVDEHVSRLKSINENIKGKDPIQIFAFFGLGDTAKLADYQKVYKEFAKSNHPDTLPQAVSDDIKKLNHDLFAQVTDAYEIMTDENKNKEYFTKVKQEEAEMQLRSEDILADAYALISRGGFSEAIPKVEQAQALYNSDKGQLYLIWCQLKSTEVQMDQVAAMLNKARDMSRHTRQLALYAFVTGLIRKKLGLKEEAIRDLEKALQLDAGFNDARRELATIKGPAGKLDMNELLTGDLSDVVSRLFSKKKRGA